MKTLCFSLVVLLLAVVSGAAAPVPFEEVSLLVRMHERDAAILSTISQRHLLRPLNAEQESLLKRAGATASLLAALRQPAMHATPAEVAAYDRQVKRQQQAARLAMASIPRTTEPKGAPQPPPTGRKLVIDRVIIKQLPVPRPFYFFAHAEAGRSHATFHIPRQRYATKMTDGPEIEIPMHLVLNNVEPNSWATVDLHLDVDPEAVKTYQALKRHTARIQILDYPQRTEFTPDLTVTPFTYELQWHAE
jgi:hypothetical protein